MGLRSAISAWDVGALTSLSLHRPGPGSSGKWRRHSLESRSRRGRVGLSLEKVQARRVLGEGRHPLLAWDKRGPGGEKSGLSPIQGTFN